ncbi:hypothetical protein RhiirC2_774714 [Rhizophagus irregularis]|uniref:Uncharacterized protein n=1 Tax=Rhizophagus irregularis TaxID=588596 RepID=A0A2N1NKV5_9GLOM|nr:hypothetical protein RhiirC2_774714 [Rhizophagus irregularis]
MTEPSNIFHAASNNMKIRELTRGIYNHNLNKLFKSNEEKKLLLEIWERCYLNIRELIWIKRCNRVIELEKSKGITKKEKKRKKDKKEDDEFEDNGSTSIN